MDIVTFGEEIQQADERQTKWSRWHTSVSSVFVKGIQPQDDAYQQTTIAATPNSSEF